MINLYNFEVQLFTNGEPIPDIKLNEKHILNMHFTENFVVILLYNILISSIFFHSTLITSTTESKYS